MLPRFAPFAGVLVFALVLNGCGGGGANSSGESGSSDNTPLQGVYVGTTTTGEIFESMVLPHDEYYALYGVPNGNILTVQGLMHGSTTSGNDKFSASVSDFYWPGAVYTGTVSGSYVPGVSVTGTVAETGNTPVNFSGTTAAAAPYNFNTPASLSSITGEWSGSLEPGNGMVMNIQSDGSFSGISSGFGCSFSGTMTPDVSNKNFYDVSLTPDAKCLGHGLPPASGIAVSYRLANGTNQLLAGGVDKTNSAVAFGLSGVPVTLSPTTTTLTASPNPAVAGSNVIFTATVTRTGLTMPPTGTVTLEDGPDPVFGSLNSSGVVTFSISFPSAGNYLINAYYNGDTNYSGSSSAVLTETINP